MAKETLQISGRAALDIARNELEFMYDKMRHNEEELNAQHVQIRVLREEKASVAVDRDELKQAIEDLHEFVDEKLEVELSHFDGQFFMESRKSRLVKAD